MGASAGSIEEAVSSITDKLKAGESISTSELALPYEAVIGAVKKLEAQGKVEATPTSVETLALTEEGRMVQDEGSPEYFLWTTLGGDKDGALGVGFTEGLEEEDLERYKRYGISASVTGLGQLKAYLNLGKIHGLKNGLIEKSGGKMLRREGQTDRTRELLAALDRAAAKDLEALKKRKLVHLKKATHYVLRRGRDFEETSALVADISSLMISDGSYRAKLKRYNFQIVSSPAKYSGALHPLSRMRDAFKRIFLEMGFEEMETGKYVETSFWNFDALFQPQKHPSRNENDTFFIQSPQTGRDPERGYFDRVKKIHSSGGYGSVGYQAPWDEDESRKNVLRTHTTAVTTRKLFSLAQSRQGKPFSPLKLFSIDKVFRNESLDATHLAEFHQVEGIVADRGLTISHLMGLLSLFFSKMGMEKVRFKPAYNPYTEPSLEVFAYHEGMKKWVEVGNSGMFRPEMLRPMGLDEDVRVIGWGLSLERPAMIKYALSNIRDLVGCKVGLDRIRS